MPAILNQGHSGIWDAVGNFWRRHRILETADHLEWTAVGPGDPASAQE